MNIIHGEKVVSLNQRPRKRSYRIGGNTCVSCDKCLQDAYIFCSLFCKLQHMLRTRCNNSKYVYKCENTSLPEPGLDDRQMAPDTVLEPASSVRKESGSSGGGGNGGEGGVSCSRTLAWAATTEIPRKKRSSISSAGSSRPVCCLVSKKWKRRKITPQP